MVVRSTIFGGILALCVLTASCESYKAERRADARDQAETLAAAEASGQFKPGELHVPKPREKVEEISSTSPTPTPEPNDLLNRPLDPAGRPPR